MMMWLNINKKKRNNKENDGFALYLSVGRYKWVLVLFLIVPYLFEKVMQYFSWWYFVNITSADWLAYGGVLVGAYFTVWALVTTINENRRVAEEQRLEAAIPNIRLDIQLVSIDGAIGPQSDNAPDCFVSLLREHETDDPQSKYILNSNIILQNIGRGPASSIKAMVLDTNGAKGVLMLPESVSNNRIVEKPITIMCKKPKVHDEDYLTDYFCVSLEYIDNYTRVFKSTFFVFVTNYGDGAGFIYVNSVDGDRIK